MRSETLFNTHHKLKPAAIDVLKMAHDYPVVLSTGHASKEEVFCLIDACIQYQVPSLLISQPAHPLMGFKAEDLKELVKQDFVWLEQTFLTYSVGHQTKEDMAEILTTLPRVIYSSDLGQTNQLDISSWLNTSRQLFTELGLTQARQNDVMLAHPLKLLSI